MKKALIYNPYLDTLGGGEFYALSVGEFLIKQGFKTEIAWLEKDILEKAKKRFDLNFGDKLKINKEAFSILKEKGNLPKKYLLTKNYQLIFFVSDGSIPFLMAKKNFLHFQSPFLKVNGGSFFNQLKLKNISSVICNSQFTKKYIDQEFKVDSQVIYPPLADVFLNLKPEKKENIILSVGRFDQIMNAKKQNILVSIFKKMKDQGLKNWRLVLLGGLMKESKYFRKLKQSAYRYPIEIMVNVKFKTLLNFYQKAKIYWHAAGFGEDLKINPQRAEHFGISVVEAMACGVVPLAFSAGGIPEIVERDKNFLWRNENELIRKTKLLIKDSDLRVKLSSKLKKRALQFNQEIFFKKLNKLL